MSIGQAMQQILAVEAMIAAMGANDSESESIKAIRDGLEKGILKPEEAVSRAEDLRDSKQAYH